MDSNNIEGMDGGLSVSIVIPVYRVEQHIERCLRSVFRQDYEGDVECILVDDCSPDSSMAVADGLLSRYTGKIRFRKIRHERNRGLSAARNTGTQAAEGDYLFYLDSDDEIMPSTVSSLVGMALKYPGVDVVYGDWYVCRKHNLLQHAENLNEYMDSQDDIILTMISDSVVSMTATNKLLRTGLVRQHSLMFKENTYHEDELFNYFLAETARSIAISYVPTYVYYLNPGGITFMPYNDRRQQDLMDIAEEIFRKGKTMYRYPACLRIMFFICQSLSEESPLLPRLKEFIRLLSISACSVGLYRYSFYLYRCYRASFRRLQKLTKSRRYNRMYSDTLGKTYRIRCHKDPIMKK